MGQNYPLQNNDQLVWLPQKSEAVLGLVMWGAKGGFLGWLLSLSSISNGWKVIVILFLGVTLYFITKFTREILGIKSTGYLLSNSSIRIYDETIYWSEIERFAVVGHSAEGGDWCNIEGLPRYFTSPEGQKALLSINCNMFIWSGYSREHEAHKVCAWLNSILQTPGAEPWQRKIGRPPWILRIKKVPVEG